MSVIVLKHLAREFDMDPFRLRQVLRKEFGYAAGRRWRWDEKADAGELKLVREFLSGRNAGKQQKGSSTIMPTSTPAKKSGRKSASEASASQEADGSPAATIVPSAGRRSSSAYVEQLREGLKTGDAFIASTAEKLSRLRAAKEGLVLGDDTTARQKLSRVKRRMKDVAKSGASPNPKKSTR